MAVYMILDIEVTDPEGYKEYLKRSGPSVDQYGGKFIVRGGQTTTLEGDWHPKRLVVIEFGSEEQANRWYNSPEYTEARAIRARTAKSVAIMALGYNPA